MSEKLPYFDVTFIGPSNSPGTHYAVQAETAEAAGIKSSQMLCYGTPFTPEDFKVTEVIPCVNPPQ